MDYLSALELGNPKKTASLPRTELVLYSHWETKTLEVFLKACAAQAGQCLEAEVNGFGSLLLDLEQLASSNAAAHSPLVILLDEESYLPGHSLRSDSLPTRQKIEAALRDAGPLIDRLCSLISQLARRRAVLLLPSTLPGFPLLPSLRWAESPLAAFRARARLAFSEIAERQPGSIIILDPEKIWRDLSRRQLLDDRLLFSGGWPLSIDATERLARAMIETACLRVESRKILITDADGALWQGLVGDDGPDKVSWAQEAETYRFFTYQKTLNLLMSEGVLVAIASKNNPEALEAALSRKELILDRGQLLACHASWAPKSEVIGQILRDARLLPSAVVFVDDSEFELGEARSAYPEIECVLFPKDNAGLRDFIENLRSRFDTRIVTEEDAERVRSLKHASRVTSGAAQAHSVSDYLAGLEMKARIEEVDPAASDRAFQLLNKTNQFNLSGRRFEAAEWKKLLDSRDRTAFQLRFQDKYGDYGIVSVLLADSKGEITDWVLSCRVFGRTIEHYMLNYVAGRLADRHKPIHLHYRDTGKNKVVRSFLDECATPANGSWVLARAEPLKTHVSAL